MTVKCEYGAWQNTKPSTNVDNCYELQRQKEHQKVDIFYKMRKDNPTLQKGSYFFFSKLIVI